MIEYIKNENGGQKVSIMKCLLWLELNMFIEVVKRNGSMFWFSKLN